MRGFVVTLERTLYADVIVGEDGTYEEDDVWDRLEGLDPDWDEPERPRIVGLRPLPIGEEA